MRVDTFLISRGLVVGFHLVLRVTGVSGCSTLLDKWLSHLFQTLFVGWILVCICIIALLGRFVNITAALFVGIDVRILLLFSAGMPLLLVWTIWAVITGYWFLIRRLFEVLPHFAIVWVGITTLLGWCVRIFLFIHGRFSIAGILLLVQVSWIIHLGAWILLLIRGRFSITRIFLLVWFFWNIHCHCLRVRIPFRLVVGRFSIMGILLFVWITRSSHLVAIGLFPIIWSLLITEILSNIFIILALHVATTTSRSIPTTMFLVSRRFQITGKCLFVQSIHIWFLIRGVSLGSKRLIDGITTLVCFFSCIKVQVCLRIRTLIHICTKCTLSISHSLAFYSSWPVRLASWIIPTRDCHLILVLHKRIAASIHTFDCRFLSIRITTILSIFLLVRIATITSLLLCILRCILVLSVGRFHNAIRTIVQVHRLLRLLCKFIYVDTMRDCHLVLMLKDWRVSTIAVDITTTTLGRLVKCSTIKICTCITTHSMLWTVHFLESLFHWHSSILPVAINIYTVTVIAKIGIYIQRFVAFFSIIIPVTSCKARTLIVAAVFLVAKIAWDFRCWSLLVTNSIIAKSVRISFISWGRLHTIHGSNRLIPRIVTTCIVSKAQTVSIKTHTAATTSNFTTASTKWIRWVSAILTAQTTLATKTTSTKLIPRITISRGGWTSIITKTIARCIVSKLTLSCKFIFGSTFKGIWIVGSSIIVIAKATSSSSKPITAIGPTLLGKATSTSPHAKVGVATF